METNVRISIAVPDSAFERTPPYPTSPLAVREIAPTTVVDEREAHADVCLYALYDHPLLHV